MIWHGFLDQELSLRLCRVLLHSLWQVTLIVWVARLAARLWPRRAVERHYAIQVTALLASLVVMPVTFAIISSGASRTAEEITLIEPPSAIRTEVSPNRLDEYAVETAVVPTVDLPPTSFAPTNALPQPIAGRTTLWMKLSPWAAGLYVIGVVLMLVRLGVGVWRANRLGHRGRTLNDGPLVEFVRTIAAKWSMRAVPVLVQVEEILVPKVVGLFRPCILLPAAALTGLSAAELEMILIHELAHLRRYDMWVNLLQRLAEAVLFFNPAAWYLSRRMSALREYCCDEIACQTVGPDNAQSRTNYALALLRVVELARQPMQPALPQDARDHDSVAALAASGRSPSQLRQRVASLFGEPIREPLRLSTGGVIAVVAVVFLVLFGLTSWQNAASSEDANAARSRYLQVAAQRKELVERIRPKEKVARKIGAPFPSSDTAATHEFEQHWGIRAGGIELNNRKPRLLADSDFSSSDFTEATLTGGQKAFSATIFVRANLSGAKLTGDAAFQGTRFDKATLSGAVLRGDVSAFQGASFNRANLKGATLSGGPAAFQGATFEGASLINAVLSAEGGGFQFASFDRAYLSGTKIMCNGLPAFQSVSVSGAKFFDADLSAIDYRSLMSCVFPSESPPKYNAATRFPKEFDPVKQGWLRAEKADTTLSKHVVLLYAESEPRGMARTFPAVVMANEGDRSILLSASWGAVPFPNEFGPAIPLGGVFLLDTPELITERVKVVAYDERLGIGVFSVDKRLVPVLDDAFADDLKPEDELTELQLSADDPEQTLRVLAVDEPFHCKTFTGQPIAVKHAIRFDGDLSQNPGSLLLKDGKVAAVFLNNGSEPSKIGQYALPIKMAREAFAQLRPVSDTPAKNAQSGEQPKTERAASLVRGKNYVIVPWANTQFQSEWSSPLNAYVLIDGNALYTKDKKFDSQALDWSQLAKDLEPLSDRGKGAVNFHVFNFDIDVSDTRVIGWALEGFGKQHAGFQRAYVSATHSGPGRFQDMIDATNRKFAGLKEGPEPVIRDPLVRVSPVRTFVSSILNGNADCVVQIIPPLEGESGQAWPVKVRAAILESVPKADVAQKKKLLIKIRFRGPAAEKMMEWINASGARELAKELGYDEGDAEGSEAPTNRRGH